jgi:catechol 2,3-dioxygenase-like lactoylglutathione lyase family enzyme
MRPLGFHHVAIFANDVERVSAFYLEVLGLPEQARYKNPDGSLRSVWISVPGGGFLAVERGVPAKAVLALRIPRDDRRAWLDRFSARGVEIDKQSRWTVYVRDPEGNVVGLSHHPEDPPA